MTRINKEQQDRIVSAAIRELDVAGEDDARTVRIALLGAADDPFDLQSLLGVFGRMMKAVRDEVTVMASEARGDGPPSPSRH
jgi:hypothetical protein